MARLITNGSYSNYWRADDATRPFFHASDAGFPVVSLLYYAEIASPEIQQKVRDAVKKSLAFQLAINQEVNNPFGYARQLTQDKDGNRRTPSSSRTTPKSRRGGRAKMRACLHSPPPQGWLRGNFQTIPNSRSNFALSPPASSTGFSA